MSKSCFLLLLLCLNLTGCASWQSKEIYNKALKTGTIVTIVKNENYQELKQAVAADFDLRGYRNVLVADPKTGFFVLGKQGDFGEPCEIILKYTVNESSYNVRVDLVKGSDNVVTDSMVIDDIQKIADQIKNQT